MPEAPLGLFEAPQEPLLATVTVTVTVVLLLVVVDVTAPPHDANLLENAVSHLQKP